MKNIFKSIKSSKLAKLFDITEDLIKNYGITRVLAALIVFLEKENKKKDELYLKNLIDDLKISLSNYNNRYSKK